MEILSIAQYAIRVLETKQNVLGFSKQSGAKRKPGLAVSWFFLIGPYYLLQLSRRDYTKQDGCKIAYKKLLHDFAINLRYVYQNVFYFSQIFQGNTDKNTVVEHQLNPVIETRYVQIIPVAWFDRISMRIELYSC